MEFEVIESSHEEDKQPEKKQISGKEITTGIFDT
jgi:hypothetical protein